MRFSPLILLAGSLLASEPTPAYPLWDGQESVADYAKKVNLPATKTLDLGNGVKLELVLIPAGKFIMGTPEPVAEDEEGFRKKIAAGQETVQGLEKAQLEYKAAKARFDAAASEEKPSHSVTLSKPYYMGKFVVTQEQYQQLTGANRSTFKGKDNPVETVSWDETQAFCKKLTEQSKQTVRLPTDAEWEYACRAGTTTTYYSGDSDAELARVAWYSANSKSTTHPVGQKEPNTFGLYDMHGNVHQWCEDRWDENDASPSQAVDPQHPVQGTFRLFRGGSWLHDPKICRSAGRFGGSPIIGFETIGFRVVAPASAADGQRKP